MQFTDRDWFLDELPQHVDYAWLLTLMKMWVETEALPFKMGVLATVDGNGHPISRTVAIREINEHGLLFFTQLGSAKVAHMLGNPQVSFTFMLPETQRQVTVLGKVRAVEEQENLKNWETYDQERRLRFLVYGTKSGQMINKQQELDEELFALKEHYKENLPARPREYVGFTIIPEVIKFYQLNEHRLSDSLTAKRTQGTWTLQRFVP
ncbi:pyridoxamine 5'-phosphate oxidase family protein [Fluoribacter dumoffii]|uniref:Pyridoxine/pyridoxamine 5'-phosphate oxidase n=1 Tax=Fluoribacter dumoffii TaxID=463 RepID=A0A377GDR0_9GAMM|nr:pyridoxamine 5'-phosphate oxidase family protein [Fluoribacter dumoffii]KTC91245.1 pyridoxamine 5'-phosphate oxidase [Fluoribacter dumoffii NY 23]MCW8387589.1 pyridoxamine 5'-phosphate oxidase family protein [Fluoribacter dumoffii]MCW8497792.1 pyridoxamine 5'-phosphate oxidase family protein [Fluoribacter dumoffii]STO22942.1 Pyridoxine/pyridoxamine 5'-phosphate oxidase [Fluoribacter dumoffii]